MSLPKPKFTVSKWEIALTDVFGMEYRNRGVVPRGWAAA